MYNFETSMMTTTSVQFEYFVHCLLYTRKVHGLHVYSSSITLLSPPLYLINPPHEGRGDKTTLRQRIISSLRFVPASTPACCSTDIYHMTDLLPIRLVSSAPVAKNITINRNTSPLSCLQKCHGFRFARENGYVRTLTGRRRHLPQINNSHSAALKAQAERQAVNSVIQVKRCSVALRDVEQQRSFCLGQRDRAARITTRCFWFCYNILVCVFCY